MHLLTPGLNSHPIHADVGPPGITPPQAEGLQTKAGCGHVGTGSMPITTSQAGMPGMSRMTNISSKLNVLWTRNRPDLADIQHGTRQINPKLSQDVGYPPAGEGV